MPTNLTATPSKDMINLAGAESTKNPLPVWLKHRLVEKISGILHKKASIADAENLLALIVAIALMPNMRFPGVLGKDIALLQQTYHQHRDNPEVEPHLRLAINQYIVSKGFDQLRVLLDKPFSKEDWPSRFLSVLAPELGIELPEPKLIEATIYAGKVYWRIVEGTQTVYSRPHHQHLAQHPAFNFAGKQTVRMTWDQFRLFKDAGKRSSTIAITKEKFVQVFAAGKKRLVILGNAIWEELKNKGILNSRNRLSDGWRALISQDIQLAALEAFVNARCTTVSARRSMSAEYYPKVTEALYAVEKDPGNEEDMSAYIAGAKIFRPERSPKEWKGTGKIHNDGPSNHPLNEWDVGTKDVLDKFVPADGDLDRDHIPATATLTLVVEKHCKQLADNIQDLRSQAEAVLRALEAEKTSQPQPHLRRVVIQTPRIVQLSDQLNELKEQVSVLETKRQALQREKYGGGINWWAIAVAKTLHDQNPTTRESGKKQAVRITNPLLDEVKIYMNILARDGASVEERIRALGALRYLYHCQAKQPVAVGDHSPVGMAAWCLLFQDEAKKQAIDVMFNTQLQAIIAEAEGFAVLSL